MKANPSSPSLKIVVLGGTGLIGRKLIPLLAQRGHRPLAASPSSGVNALTGEGLAVALAGADAVVDVTNSPSFAPDAVLDFFTRSTRHLTAAARNAGVRHLVALSIVGIDRGQPNAYFKAKLAQEALIREAGLPYTIVRATQFFEFAGGIADTSTVNGAVRVAPNLMQPIAADDVARALADAVLDAPLRASRDIAGPEPIRQTEFVERYLRHVRDARPVVADPAAGYFGAPVDDASLTPGPVAWLGAVRFGDWLAARPAQN